MLAVTVVVRTLIADDTRNIVLIQNTIATMPTAREASTATQANINDVVGAWRAARLLMTTKASITR